MPKCCDVSVFVCFIAPWDSGPNENRTSFGLKEKIHAVIFRSQNLFIAPTVLHPQRNEFRDVVKQFINYRGDRFAI